MASAVNRQAAPLDRHCMMNDQSDGDISSQGAHTSHNEGEPRGLLKMERQ